MAISILGCGDGEAERKTQALNTAQSWAEESTDTVITEIVKLVTSGVPGASLFTEVIADQIVDQLSWDFSEPVEVTESLFAVSATVSTQASLDLPIVGSKTYEAKLPFDLQVDVNTGSVAVWSVDFDNGVVGEK